MSTPKNHHFVSQIHLKNFFNSLEKKIYVYDKVLENHFYKKTTKSLFSEVDLNTKFTEKGKDYFSLEKDLNDNFESGFAESYNTIKEFIQHRELTLEVEIALKYFAKYGVIGDFRTPRFKKNMDDSLFNALSEISQNAAPELKKEIEEIFSFKKEVKYSNWTDFSELADKILDLMGNLIFKIQIPRNEDDYFLIPDISSATARAKINAYFNPDIEEIAYIGIPLSSKIYIHFHSVKLFKEEIPPSVIYHCTTEEVKTINKNNLDYCQSKVACENENYLKKFIKDVQTFA